MHDGKEELVILSRHYKWEDHLHLPQNQLYTIPQKSC